MNAFDETNPTVDVWIAELETRHFTFMAVGETEDHALRTLLAALRAHQVQLDCSVIEYFGDRNVYKIPVGGCLRDDRVIIEGVE